MLIDGLESYGLLVDYCDVFINRFDFHSDLWSSAVNGCRQNESQNGW